MATSVQFRPQNRDLGMVMRDVDEDLAIFLGIRNGEKERNDLVQIHNFVEFDGSTSAESKLDSLLIEEEAFQIVVDDSLLNSETGKSDHNWLVTEQDAAANEVEISNGEGISVNSEPVNASEESPPPADSSSAAANKRPASSGGRKPASRAATPTRRPALPVKSKPSRASTPTSRASSRATTTTTSKPMAAIVRSSTPSRAAATSSSSKPVSRSSTPSRATSRSSTPSSRSTMPATSKPASRSATPTRKPATPSTTTPSMSASDGGRKTSSVAVKNPVPTRGNAQTVKSRSSNPTAILSVSHDASHNLKASLPKRPASASRGRPSAPAALSSSSNTKPRQKSCSPAKTRAPNNGPLKTGSTTLSRSRGYSHSGGDEVNPVLMGTKMVERVVNMRKLAPPKQDDHMSLEKPKKSSHENSGFGRSLSNRSLDMAMRHMDIRRSVAGNLRPVATSSVLSYFASGNQSSSSQSSSFGVSESPITSSSDSSKSSNCVNSYFLD